MKTCSKCGVSKEDLEFHKRALAKDGLAWQCKACYREYHKKTFIPKHPPRTTPELSGAYKNCPKCLCTKDTSEFYPDKTKKDGRHYCCCSCNKAYRKNWVRRVPAPPSETKTCKKCGFVKNKSEFGRCGASGPRSEQLRTRCNLCLKQDSRDQYWKDPEKRRSQQNAWMAAHPDYCPKVNPEANRQKSKRYRDLHPDAYSARYHSDPGFKLSVNLRGRIYKALKWAGINKSERTKELIGCPIVWLEVHLESLFTPGMTWENHGPVWHIDHIKPCASFDLTDSEQQKICFHWTNQQPLFASENIRKGAKYNG